MDEEKLKRLQDSVNGEEMEAWEGRMVERPWEQEPKYSAVY